MKQPVMCAAGRHIGTELDGWTEPCPALADTSVWIRGIRPDDFPVYLCMDHRLKVDDLDIIEPPERP